MVKADSTISILREKLVGWKGTVSKDFSELFVARPSQLQSPNFVFFYQFIDNLIYLHIQRISKSKILRGLS
jgi:hypothetical protein